VLAELDDVRPDLLVFGGDLTWGAQPAETYRLVSGLDNALFVRGNADRAVLEGLAERDRERWMQEQHSAEMRDFLAGFGEHQLAEVDGLGAVRFCHGSPRSDEECVTPETPEERVREFMTGVDERLVVTAHVHIQFDRSVAGVRSVNAGSVGLPYEGRPGAYWALLGPDVELRRTEYDLEAAVAQMRATDDPSAEQIVEIMLEPPSREEAIEHAEKVVFAE
jgi:predicted phosphodiesterase